jgi:hypothetical protein
MKAARAVAALLVAAAWGWAWMHVEDAKRDAIQRTYRANANLAQAYADQASAMLAAAGADPLRELDAARIAQAYRGADLGPEGVVLLLGLDGVAYVRAAGNAVSFGEDAGSVPVLAAQRRSATGFVRGAGGIDAIERLYSYRTIPGVPLVVAVGSSAFDALVPVNRSRRDACLLALLASVLALLSYAALGRHARSLGRPRAALETTRISGAH